MKLEHNILRLKHLLNLYHIETQDFLMMISNRLKNPIREKDIFSEEIKLNHLKRIDKVFNKGLHFYLDPAPPINSKDSSIFFRKEKFNSNLNIGAKKIINHFEDFKISLSAISKLTEISQTRNLPVYSIKDNPKLVAQELREQLYPTFTSNKHSFLKSLITKLAENSILVFEFVETWNKTERANLDGFFLQPNVIVLKRNQSSFRREIFTLTHELGHYLLNQEEVDELDYQQLIQKDISQVERWCNEFAYYFLAGNYAQEIYALEKAKSQNDYHADLIKNISKNTHLSQIAIYTNLLFQEKISRQDYKKVKQQFDDEYLKIQKQRLLEKELAKNMGIKSDGRSPKPIKSPLLISIIQTAFHEGVINEYEACQKLNIKPENIDKYLL